MPGYTHHQFRWSEQRQTYILTSGDQLSEHSLTPDWLEQVDSFAFHSRSGMHFTARKQRVQRGGNYWYGYRRLHGKIAKCYLGKSETLTLARLEQIARLLEDKERSHLSDPSPRETPLLQALVKDPPLLLSKLAPVRLPGLLLDRPRLFRLLDDGRGSRLMLLSAPAGFGKTTLVSQWLAIRPDFSPVAWLSLETADNDPSRFWRYLITACQAFQIDFGRASEILQEMIPRPPLLPASVEAVLTPLLNELACSPTGGILVLEDYHVIITQEIHEMLSFFLEHLPTHVQLVILSRSDPPLPLARLRMRNDLYEVRARDLRFSQEEAMALLQQSVSFPLTTESIATLHARMEGWGAGLHLARLALQKATSSIEGEDILAHFAQAPSPLQEYFISEILNQQEEPFQQFLLQTSMLTRLNGSLCDELTEQRNSQEILTRLERANLLLEPVDSSGQWYCYHALFAEAVRNEAQQRLGEEHLQRLSSRAARWYEAHDMFNEAIEAALYGRDYPQAAALIERFIEAQSEMREPHTLHRLLKQLPIKILEQHPLLCLSYATTLLFLNGSWHPAQPVLHTLERLLQRAEACFLAEHNLPKLGEIFAFRSLLAWRTNDMREAALQARQALDWLPQTRQLWRVLSLCMLGRELLETGDFQQARVALTEAIRLCDEVKNRYFRRISSTLLAQALYEMGEPYDASAYYRQTVISAREDTHIESLCYALTGLAALSYEWNEMENAYQQAQEVLELKRSVAQQTHTIHATLTQARVLQAQGQSSIAQQRLATLLDELPSSDLSREVQTAQCLLALEAEDHLTVHRWTLNRTPCTNLQQEMEEGLLLARWLRIRGNYEEATRTLEHLLATSQKTGNMRRELALQVEMVLLLAARKSKPEALLLLQRVVEQSFGRLYKRLFLDTGEQMAILLRSLLPQLHEQSLRTYVRTLLNAFPVQAQENGQAALLHEPLSPQELRVLRLLVQHKTNAEIANKLVVSINTVRTQVQSIYRKLGVNKRSEASEIVRELHLL